MPHAPGRYTQPCLGAWCWVISWSHSCIHLPPHCHCIPYPIPCSNLAHPRPRFCPQKKQQRWQQEVALLLPFLSFIKLQVRLWIIGSFWRGTDNLSWSHYRAGLPSGQVLRGEYGAVAGVGSELNIMEWRAAKRSPPGSRLWIMSVLETLKIHSPPALPLQLLHRAASARSGPGHFDSHCWRGLDPLCSECGGYRTAQSTVAHLSINSCCWAYEPSTVPGPEDVAPILHWLTDRKAHILPLTWPPHNHSYGTRLPVSSGLHGKCSLQSLVHSTQSLQNTFMLIISFNP